MSDYSTNLSQEKRKKQKKKKKEKSSPFSFNKSWKKNKVKRMQKLNVESCRKTMLRNSSPFFLSLSSLFLSQGKGKKEQSIWYELKSVEWKSYLHAYLFQPLSGWRILLTPTRFLGAWSTLVKSSQFLYI